MRVTAGGFLGFLGLAVRLRMLKECLSGYFQVLASNSEKVKVDSHVLVVATSRRVLKF